MPRTKHTMVITFTIQSNAPEPGDDVDVETITIDDEDVAYGSSTAWVDLNNRARKLVEDCLP